MVSFSFFFLDIFDFYNLFVRSFSLKVEIRRNFFNLVSFTVHLFFRPIPRSQFVLISNSIEKSNLIPN